MKQNQVTTTIRLDAAIWKYCKKICIDKRISFQSFVEEAIKQAIRNEPIKKEEN